MAQDVFGLGTRHIEAQAATCSDDEEWLAVKPASPTSGARVCVWSSGRAPTGAALYLHGHLSIAKASDHGCGASR